MSDTLVAQLNPQDVDDLLRGYPVTVDANAPGFETIFPEGVRIELLSPEGYKDPAAQ